MNYNIKIKIINIYNYLILKSKIFYEKILLKINKNKNYLKM